MKLRLQNLQIYRKIYQRAFLRTQKIESESHVSKYLVPPLRVETSGCHIRPTQEDEKAKEERECFAPLWHHQLSKISEKSKTDT